jgi:iron complex transport system substrate-binding protein
VLNTCNRLLAKGVALSLVTAAWLPGMASAKDVVVPHARGTITIRDTPARVAVFDLATLDNLHALGIDGVAGVPKGTEGKSNFPPHLAQYRGPGYRNVGTLFEPDLRALTALRPDLIVIGGRSSKAYDALTGIAPAIDMSSPSKDVAALTIANTRKLGRIFGVEQRAERRTAEFGALIGRLRAQGGKAGTGLVLFGAGESVTPHAPGDRFGHVYDFVGILSAVAAARPPASESISRTRPPAGSPEAAAQRQAHQATLKAALAANPTWLFVIDRIAATSGEPSAIAERLRANADVAATSAWKAGRVIYLDPKTWYIIGAGIDALSTSAQDTLTALEAG